MAHENVYLVRARSPAEALRKGIALGKEAAKPDDTLRWNGAPARHVVAGTRKVISCASNVKRPGDGFVREIGDGDEATYSLFVVRDRARLRRLVQGKPVEIEYVE